MLPPDAVPPCMTRISRQLEDGKNVPHRGRLAYASFLVAMGEDVGEVCSHFAKTQNYDAAKTRRIVDDLQARGYMPQSCKAMAADGLCSEAMRQSLCQSIRNPVSWGRIRSGGRAAPSPRRPVFEEPTMVICKCSKRLGPFLGMGEARRNANRHYWENPAEVDGSSIHSEVEYEAL